MPTIIIIIYDTENSKMRSSYSRALLKIFCNQFSENQFIFSVGKRYNFCISANGTQFVNAATDQGRIFCG